ncbi:hypothetical protein BDQ17DRAFT_1429485 [Cyathus striatus]|nr:hypothetical protein BDQ17DRAFT_1429485 [Cyathus striatus]
MSLPLNPQHEIFKPPVRTEPHHPVDAHLTSVSPLATQSCAEPKSYKYIKICGSNVKTVGYVPASEFLLSLVDSRTVKCIEFESYVPNDDIVKVLSICGGIEALRYCATRNILGEKAQFYRDIKNLSNLRTFETDEYTVTDLREYQNGILGFKKLTVLRMSLHYFPAICPLHWLPALTRIELIVSNKSSGREFNFNMLRTLREIVGTNGLNSIHIEFTQYRNGAWFNLEEWEAVDSRISVKVTDYINE